jgi:hypothetical protein
VYNRIIDYRNDFGAKMKEYKHSDNVNYNQDINDVIKLYEDVTGHFASRTHTLILNCGNIGALEALMDNVKLQKGFKTLRDKNMLDKTFEAVMVKYKNEIDFDKSAVKIAEFRLKNPQWDKGL